jgi:hypothetical protein
VSICICYSVILIAVACGAIEMLLNRLLTSVFHVMVFTVDIDELRSTRNAERLKRDLRVMSRDDVPLQFLTLGISALVLWSHCKVHCAQVSHKSYVLV